MTKIIVVIILVYLMIGIVMVLWDFRKILFGYGKQQTISSIYIVPPKFLSNLTISTALKFILIWPYKLLSRFID
jgi:hypothetical protein